MMQKLLNHWYVPILFCVGSTGFFAVSQMLFSQSFFLQVFSFFIFMSNLIIIPLSLLMLLKKKMWVKVLATIIIASASLFAGLLVFSVHTSTLLFDELEGDHWADNLTIPQNIAIEKPISIDPFNIASRSATLLQNNPDFQLYNSFQPGLYEYDFVVGNIDPGTIYLKVYEITQNTPLSADHLRKTTALRVHNSSGKLQIFSTQRHFTIYEGDWGKPYAARFEVWYKSDSDSDVKKLLEKNYIIEGWQR